MLLAGDIGGTKTILAVYSAEHGPHSPVAIKVFASANYDSLEAIIREFLAIAPFSIAAACFGVGRKYWPMVRKSMSAERRFP